VSQRRNRHLQTMGTNGQKDKGLMTEAAGACQERHSPHRRATRPSSAAGRVSLCTHLRPRDRATPIFPMLRVCCWGWCRCGRLSRRLGSTGKAPTLRCPAPTCRLLSLRQCLVCRCCLVALWRVVIGIRGNEWVEIFCIKCSHIAYLGNKIVLVLAGIRVGEMRCAIPSTHWDAITIVTSRISAPGFMSDSPLMSTRGSIARRHGRL
jgi:hypothetical protein